MRVSVANSDRSFSTDPARPLLQSALQAGLKLPFSCRNGNCGACRARLLAGRVTYPGGPPLGLSPDEAAEGYILLCRAHAQGDLELETVEVATPEQALVRRLPARIERLELLTHDVMGLHLKLPPAETFSFRAGQYVDLLLPGGRRRSFSIASAPPRSAVGGPLELHVRRVEGGAFSERLFTTAQVGDLLYIEGPHGRFVYTPGRAPVVMIGGGTGIAPLLSMLRDAAARPSAARPSAARPSAARPLAVYWGVRGERDLYAHATLEDLGRRLATMRYTPVLSAPSDAWSGATGWVHAAALAPVADLSTVDVYAAGPPAMIAAIREEFSRRGAAPSRLACDVFDYAVDVPARQVSSADTKS